MEVPKFRAEPRSREKIRTLAKRLRAILGLENEIYVDIVFLAEVVFPRVFEKHNYSFSIGFKHEMGNTHGITNPDTGSIVIREDVYEGACMGNGRDRMTIAHEIGHFLMHKGLMTGLARVGKGDEVPTFCDPEWQAAAFAGEFLMDIDVIRNMTVSEVVEKCGVSLDAAAYQKKKIQ